MFLLKVVIMVAVLSETSDKADIVERIAVL
jgi:hypothetical protein